MIVVVSYDISDEEKRARLRRYLRRLGLSRVNRSVYAGPGTVTTAKLISKKVKDIIGGNDSVFIIVVREDEYQRAYVFEGRDHYVVQERKYEIY